jgi:hypothetical protein
VPTSGTAQAALRAFFRPQHPETLALVVALRAARPRTTTEPSTK